MSSVEAAAFASPRGGSLRISGFVGEPSAGRMPLEDQARSPVRSQTEAGGLASGHSWCLTSRCGFPSPFQSFLLSQQSHC